MKIIWSPLAVQRLESIHDYIAEDNLSAANDLVDKIFAKIETLPENPERGRIIPEVNRADIRELFEKEYRIIYRIDPGKIIILSIRNFKQLLPGDDIV